jgi:hypothetical protein
MRAKTLLSFMVLLIVLVGYSACLRSALADPSGPFVWGETTHVAAAGWGRMIRLNDDRWLCVVNLFPKPHSLWQLRISDDGARTWTPLTTVTEAGRDLDNGELLQRPDGDLLLTGRSVVGHRDPSVDPSYHLPVYHSADGGKTWAFLSQIDTSEPGPYRPGQLSVGLWEPHLFLLPDGRVACAYANEKHAVEKPSYSQVVSERVSPDGGRTWGHEITLAAQIGGGGQRPGMPVLARMKDGRFCAVYEVVGVGDADVYFKTSRDGVTWPPGVGVCIPGQHAGPWVTALSDGRLVVTSCENQISVSDDLGATWRITTPPAWPLGHINTWPAIYQTAPDRIAVMKSYRGVDLRWGQLR